MFQTSKPLGSCDQGFFNLQNDEQTWKISIVSSQSNIYALIIVGLLGLEHSSDC